MFPLADRVSLVSESITFLPAGAEPSDPQSVLASEPMRQLLTELGEEHDTVLIDSPPLLPVSDAVALAGEADGVVIVGRIGRVTPDDGERVADLLERIPGALALGVVVNDVSALDGYGYGYGYGYGPDKPKS